jgi:hypothetical protein
MFRSPRERGNLSGMSTRPRSHAGPPMTLGNMRANGVRSLAVSCWQCRLALVEPVRLDVRLWQAPHRRYLERGKTRPPSGRRLTVKIYPVLRIGRMIHPARQERPQTRRKSASIASLRTRAFVWKRQDTAMVTAGSTSSFSLEEAEAWLAQLQRLRTNQREFHELHHHRYGLSRGIVSQKGPGCGGYQKSRRTNGGWVQRRLHYGPRWPHPQSCRIRPAQRR